SYWLTELGLFEFCGCSPAYFVPAVPFGLNAEPGADAALPGRVLWSSHDWLGCPVALAIPPVPSKRPSASVLVRAMRLRIVHLLEECGQGRPQIIRSGDARGSARLHHARVSRSSLLPTFATARKACQHVGASPIGEGVFGRGNMRR